LKRSNFLGFDVETSLNNNDDILRRVKKEGPRNKFKTVTTKNSEGKDIPVYDDDGTDSVDPRDNYPDDAEDFDLSTDEPLELMANIVVHLYGPSNLISEAAFQSLWSGGSPRSYLSANSLTYMIADLENQINKFHRSYRYQKEREKDGTLPHMCRTLSANMRGAKFHHGKGGIRNKEGMKRFYGIRSFLFRNLFDKNSECARNNMAKFYKVIQRVVKREIQRVQQQAHDGGGLSDKSSRQEWDSMPPLESVGQGCMDQTWNAIECDVFDDTVGDDFLKALEEGEGEDEREGQHGLMESL